MKTKNSCVTFFWIGASYFELFFSFLFSATLFTKLHIKTKSQLICMQSKMLCVDYGCFWKTATKSNYARYTFSSLVFNPNSGTENTHVLYTHGLLPALRLWNWKLKWNKLWRKEMTMLLLCCAICKIWKKYSCFTFCVGSDVKILIYTCDMWYWQFKTVFQFKYTILRQFIILFSPLDNSKKIFFAHFIFPVNHNMLVVAIGRNKWIRTHMSMKHDIILTSEVHISDFWLCSMFPYGMEEMNKKFIEYKTRKMKIVLSLEGFRLSFPFQFHNNRVLIFSKRTTQSIFPPVKNNLIH